MPTHRAAWPILVLAIGLFFFSPTRSLAAGDLKAGICYQINTHAGRLEIYATLENTGSIAITKGASYTIEGTVSTNILKVPGTQQSSPHWELAPGEGYTSDLRLELPFADGNSYHALGAMVSAPQDTISSNNIFTLSPSARVSGAELRRNQSQFKCSWGTWKRSELTPWQGPSGGAGGAEFVDSPMPASHLTRVSEVRICGGSFVDSVRLFHEPKPGAPQGLVVATFQRHGGPGGRCRTFSLQAGDYITKIEGGYDRFVTKLCVHTQDRGSLGCVGAGAGSGSYRYVAPPGMEIAGFGGREGTYLDAIGVIFRTR